MNPPTAKTSESPKWRLSDSSSDSAEAILVWLGVVMIKVAGCVALDRWRWVLLPVAGVAEGILEEPHDRVLGRRDDLVDLRRDQTCAVQEVLGDLGSYAVRHLRVV
jgi:hypothetical protein